MPADQRSSHTPPRSPRPADAVERLYVYWLVSTAVLLIALVVAVLLTHAAVRRQVRVVDDLTANVEALRQDLDRLKAGDGLIGPTGAETGRAVTRSPTPREVPREPPRPPPAVVRRPPAATQDATPPPASPAEQHTELSEDAIGARLDELITPEPATVADVLDPQGAAELVGQALNQLDRVQWSGAIWMRLACLARLLGRDLAAESFARQAEAAGQSLTTYWEVSARCLLAVGRVEEALPIASRLVEQGSPVGTVLLAAALLAGDDPAGADQTLEQVAIPPATYDQLVLARVLLELEDWSRLATVLSEVSEVPPKLAAEHSFLTAVSLSNQGRNVEALAILDGLVAETAPEGVRKGLPDDQLPWRWPGPDQYEIEVWRGVTLMLAQQPEAAREVLQQAAQLAPDRAQAHYYLGLLEARTGRTSTAKSHLKNALARTPRMAAAWEGLAVLEIDEGDVKLGLEHLAQAVAINPRRASAHFLRAVGHAKLSQAQAAAQALQTAFQLDPRYLEEAKQTEVLLGLFTADEMERLAGRAASAEPR